MMFVLKKGEGGNEKEKKILNVLLAGCVCEEKEEEDEKESTKYILYM